MTVGTVRDSNLERFVFAAVRRNDRSSCGTAKYGSKLLQQFYAACARSGTGRALSSRIQPQRNRQQMRAKNGRLIKCYNTDVGAVLMFGFGRRIGGHIMPRVQLPAVTPKHKARNKRRISGQKRPLLPKQVWAIHARLELAGDLRDLALFNVAIDRKLRGCDLVKLAVTDLVKEDRKYSLGSTLEREFEWLLWWILLHRKKYPAATADKCCVSSMPKHQCRFGPHLRHWPLAPRRSPFSDCRISLLSKRPPDTDKHGQPLPPAPSQGSIH